MPTLSMLDSVPPEALMGIAEGMLSNKRIEEDVIYYRKPEKTPDGKPHSEPGWITWSDSQAGKQLELWKKGWSPLNAYGSIRPKKRDDAPDGPYDLYGPWGPILAHPTGPREFPVEQILTYRWYDAERCPVPGVRFPQLRQWLAEGNEISEYGCPECNTAVYSKPIFLARHLRVSHSYDRAEIIALGRELGVDFSKELVRRGSGKITYDYEDAPVTHSVDPADEPVPVVRTVPQSHKGAGVPRRALSEDEKATRREALARGRATAAANRAARGA